MRKIKRKKKDEGRKIALERIAILFRIAEAKALEGDIDYSSSCVRRARAIAMRFNIRIPKEYNGRCCRFCRTYLVPGRNSRVRTNPEEKRVEVACLACGKKTFYPYARESRARRRSVAREGKK